MYIICYKAGVKKDVEGNSSVSQCPQALLYTVYRVNNVMMT